MKRICCFIFTLLIICVSIVGCSSQTNDAKEITPSKILIYNESKECIGETLLDEYGNTIKTFLESGDILEDFTAEYEYDKSGNILKKTYISEDDTYTEEHEYDRAGNIIKTSFHREHPSFTYSYTEELEYDKYGNVTRKTHTEDADKTTVTEYKYTYENEEVKTCETITDGKATSVTEYTYDKNGNVVKSYVSISNGAVINILENEYDEYNNPTQTCTTVITDSTEQIMLLEYDNEYDENGNLIRTAQYNVIDGERQFAAEYEYIYN